MKPWSNQTIRFVLAATFVFGAITWCSGKAEATPLHQRGTVSVYLSGPIVNFRWVRQLRQVGKNTPAGVPVVIHVNSLGGKVEIAAQVVDEMRRLERSHPVTTVADYMVASCAVPVFEMGNHRILAPNALFLIHRASLDKAGRHKEPIGGPATTWMFRIIAARSKLSVADLTRRTQRSDWTVSYYQARRLGLAD